MGSDEFPKNVFKKVFETDMERLRGLEDMWTEREAPKVLLYDELQEASTSTKLPNSNGDQGEWSMEENFVVFKDRLVLFVPYVLHNDANLRTAWIA